MNSLLKTSVLVLVAIGASSAVVSPVHAQAEVETDTVINGYFMDDYEGNLQFRSAGASEPGFLAVILNTGWGCWYPVNTEDDLNRLHDVLTPSENTNQSSSGPMLHIIWPAGSDPCNPGNWIAGGYGQFSSSWKTNAKNDSFSGRFTASGYFPDEADICEGDYVAYSAIWHVAGDNNDLFCNLDPFNPDISGCKKVDEKVHLVCPDL